MTDLTRVCGVFGGQIEIVEVDELCALRLAVTEAETCRPVESFDAAFDVQPDCDSQELDKAAATGVALDKLVAAHKLTSQVKHGPVTLLSVVEDSQTGYDLLVAEDDSVEGPIIEIGNTNSHYHFSLGARGFINRWNSHGPAHHCAVGLGYVAAKIEKLATLLGIPPVCVCRCGNQQFVTVFISRQFR